MQIFWLLAFLPPSSLSVSKSSLFYYFVDWIRACYCMSPSSLSTFYFRPVSQEKKKGVGGKSGRPRTKKDVSGRPVPFLPVCSSKKSRNSSIRLRVKKRGGDEVTLPPGEFHVLLSVVKRNVRTARTQKFRVTFGQSCALSYSHMGKGGREGIKLCV